MHAEHSSSRAHVVSTWARCVEVLVAGGLLVALYLVANAWGAAEGNGLLSGVVALAGALLWWLALGSRLIGAVVGPVVAAASGEGDDEWGSDGELVLDPRLAGVWLKVRALRFLHAHAHARHAHARHAQARTNTRPLRPV
jgi:hypothetical protein